MKLYTADRVLTEDSGAAHEPGAVLVDGPTLLWVGPAADLPTAYPVRAADLGPDSLPPFVLTLLKTKKPSSTPAQA